VWHASWHPSGALLATCGGDRSVRLWRRRRGVWVCAACLEDVSPRTVRCVEWSPDGRLLACAAIDGKVAALWLVAVFAIQTVGELMLSPVGMAAATRLSPPDRVSQTLGVWFLATSVGDAIGGRIAVYYDELGQQAFFGLLGVIALVAAIVVLAIAKPLGRLVPD
jgi:WD40 repeat protein